MSTSPASAPPGTPLQFSDLKEGRNETDDGATDDQKDLRISELEIKLNIMLDMLSKKEVKKEEEAMKEADEPTSIADLIGVNDFCTDSRNNLQIKLAGASSISAKDHATLSTSEKSKLLLNATRGISPINSSP
jgi:hypothetical protein